MLAKEIIHEFRYCGFSLLKGHRYKIKVRGRSRFQLADHVIVTGAELRNGLLRVELVRELPEAKKPRKIEIGAPKKGGKPKLVAVYDCLAASA